MPDVLIRDVRRGRRRRLAVVAIIALGLTGVLLVASDRVGLMTVTSSSMAPTHEQGSHLLTTSFGSGDVQLRDVVVFRTPQSWADAAAQADGLGAGVTGHMVKRIIGMPGDTVECCTADGEVILNGTALNEDYLVEPPAGANNPSFRVTVPEGHVWVMGDNRRRSFDSRAMHARGNGFLPMSAISGRPLLRLP